MNSTLLLPWFPIVLSVGVAGRLLGRRQGLYVGFACALFWVALVQGAAGVGIWQHGWTVMSLVSGSLAIFLMGGWSAQRIPGSWPTASEAYEAAGPPVHAASDQNVLTLISQSIGRFDEWLGDHRDDSDPWPAFGEFVRGMLHQCCGASLVQPYRLRADDEELTALHATEAYADGARRSARQGIPGHVATTGRSFITDDPAQGALVRKLADDAGERIAWCFPTTSGTRRLGVVVVGRLGIAPDQNGPLLQAVERLVNQFWCAVSETLQRRSSAQRDPVSGLLTRPAFLRAADATLRDSLRVGEPVALAVVALEGLRDLSDTGRWEQADEVVADVARSLKEKLRSDDCLGRFDGSRFVLLLRRVDSELAALIMGQLASRLTAIEKSASRSGAEIHVRCGVVGSGTDRPELRSLVSRALNQARRARESSVGMATDLPKRNAKTTRVPAENTAMEGRHSAVACDAANAEPTPVEIALGVDADAVAARQRAGTE